MAAPSPFHAGETLVQTRLGVRDVIEPFARRVVRDHLPEQHREFYAQLPFVVVAARDSSQRPWVTLLANPGGVLSAADAHTLEFHALPVPGDALAQALAPGADVGVLGIEFHTRRRNRVNGRVSARGTAGFRLGVEQSFGNCPQFIHARAWQAVGARQPAATPVAACLSARQQAWIAAADTFFLASGYRGPREHRAYGMDASHRGGPAGFVRVLDARTLAWPDYAGNNHFNTLGNLVMDARIGLAFVDFAAGSVLQLSGTAVVHWAPDQTQWPGTQRVVEVNVTHVAALHEALSLRWHAAPPLALLVDEVVQDGEDVRSFWLRRADGEALPPFRAGQHLPITLDLGDSREERSYSLSSAPVERRWRISVKRRPGGRVSSHLHDALTRGARVEAGLPTGDFVLSAATSALVLIGAGIGVTPLLGLLAEGAARGRAVTFLYAARHSRAAPLLAEIESLARSTRARLHRVFSQPGTHDARGVHFDTAGRMTPPLVRAMLPTGECEIYLCGPTAFVADVRGWLLATGLAATAIHVETFG